MGPVAFNFRRLQIHLAFLIRLRGGNCLCSSRSPGGFRPRRSGGARVIVMREGGRKEGKVDAVRHYTHTHTYTYLLPVCSLFYFSVCIYIAIVAKYTFSLKKKEITRETTKFLNIYSYLE